MLPQLIALIRRLLVASELQAAGRRLDQDGPEYGLSSNPRALEKLAGQAARYQPEDFDRAYALLLACDRAIKTGETEPEVAVELLVAELAGVRLKTEYVDQARSGDHICYISDLTKLKTHYPGWRVETPLRAIVEEIVDNWRTRARVSA